MNQTQKRLSIINLAISIGDTETIQLQILKLSPLKGDERIQEIIRGLQAENYAQTQALITEYIETPPEEILQRTPHEETQSEEEDEAIIQEFDLFRVNTPNDDEKTEEIFDIDGFGNTADTPQENTSADYDALLNIKSEDVLPHALDMQQTLETEDDFFSAKNTEQPKAFDYTEVVEKDDFFHTDETEESAKIPNESETPLKEEMTAHPEETSLPEENTIPESYEPIPYIDQKLKNMQTQYPPRELPEDSFASADAWMMKISNEGYTEQEIEEMMVFIQTLKEKGDIAEAAQLLLISAATQSKYAHFMLARALFKGDLLEQNLPESFTLINRLAMDDDYPEAICDLGQLYEYGIGIDKDTQRAEELYREAMDLGIKRAQSHYNRVHEINRGLLGKLFGKK